MLSFLIDAQAFLGTGSAPLLSEGDQAPIAVNDPLSVFRNSGAVTVSVLDNDVDPEGQPLTLISAFAALGTAVAEPDGTVTYTPPQGPAAASADFDTVVYEIEDVAGGRDTGEINVTITDPVLGVTTVPGNTLEVSASAGPIDLTITDPAVFAGTYSPDLADLAAGPVNLVVPDVTGTVATGNVLTATAGLWIHDIAAGTPSQSWQWQRAGADIPGANSASYTVQAADIGAGVRIVETLTDTNGARSAPSATLGAFSPSADTALLGWWAADDAASITTDVGGAVTAWAAQTVGPDLTQSAGARQPTTGTRTLNGLNVIDFDGGDVLDQTISLPASGNVAFHMLLEIDSTANAFEAVLAVDGINDFQIDSNNAAQFDGRLNTTGVGTSTNLSGGPFAGAIILSVVCDFTGAGTLEVFVGGVSRGTTTYLNPLDTSIDLHLMTNRSQNAWVNGAVAEFAITEDVSNRASYHAYLASKWGLG